MQRDKEYLLDILDAASLALTYVAEKTRDDFLEDTQCQDAVIRRLEIMGEAARRVSEHGREAFPHLPWEAMIGIRNILIHEYNDVDLDVVWDTIQIDLPPVVAALEKIVPPRH